MVDRTGLRAFGAIVPDPHRASVSAGTPLNDDWHFTLLQQHPGARRSRRRNYTLTCSATAALCPCSKQVSIPPSSLSGSAMLMSARRSPFSTPTLRSRSARWR